MLPPDENAADKLEEFDPSSVADLLDPSLKSEGFEFVLEDEESEEFEISNPFLDQKRAEPQFGEIAKPEIERKPVLGAAESVFEAHNQDSEIEKPEINQELESSVEKKGWRGLKDKVTAAREAVDEEKKGKTETEDSSIPARFEFKDDEEGFFGKIKTKIKLAKEDSEEETVDAGLDLAPSGFLAGIKNKLKSGEGEEEYEHAEAGSETASGSAFSQILTPLSGSDIAVLQAEVAADETIFHQINRTRSSSQARQQIGFMLGVIIAFGFYFVSGVSYLTETLPNVSQPSWTPDALVGDYMAAILFTLGLLMPLAVILIFSQSIRYLIGGIVEIKLENILFGVTGVVLALMSLYSLFDGEVLTALAILLFYSAIAIIARILKI